MPSGVSHFRGLGGTRRLNGGWRVDGQCKCGLLALKWMPRNSVSFEARPQRPSRSLGVTMMRRSVVKGKCGLPVP